MPLKHTTETFLIILLAALMAVTGIVLSTLPPLVDGGMLPWAAVFAATVLYPLVLSPVFRTGRADYAFRLLHWFPAFLTALWLAFQALFSLMSAAERVFDWYVWGWTLPGVLVGFVLLMVFCVRVLRRWTARIMLLALLLIPFAAGAVMNEQYHWNQQLASILWQAEWWQVQTGTGSRAIADVPDKNLEHSQDPSEESYRDRLRAIEQRRARIALRLRERELMEAMGESSKSVALESSVASSAPSVGSSYGQASSRPSNLPQSGMRWDFIVLAMLAGYCTALQKSTHWRVHVVA